MASRVAVYGAPSEKAGIYVSSSACFQKSAKLAVEAEC